MPGSSQTLILGCGDGSTRGPQPGPVWDASRLLPQGPTTTGCRKVMKVQKRPRSSIRARRTACFSVSSSSRYMSLTSCRALSSWGCRSPFPGGWGGEAVLGTLPLAASMAQAPWWCPWLGAGHCRGGQGPGEGSQDAGTCRGAGPQSRQRGQTDTYTGKTPKLPSHPGPGVGSPGQCQGRPWNSYAQGPPRRPPPPRTLTACRMAPSRLLGYWRRWGWKQSKVEHGAQLSSRPWSGEQGRGVSPCGPPLSSGAMHRTAMATPRSRERREDDVEEQ